ncbi:MAG TPA: metal ABC transporter ATP-binding protein [Polyangia bacterium]|nr:metal ABC transporter ATP-binding protein [Polyangia bacterium]
MALIALNRVEVGYHRTAVLPPLDLAIEAGDAWGIVGPNGSGKTTLVRTLLGLLKPVRGTLELPSRRRPRFGYVPQRAAVDVGFPLTAFEVALMGRYGLLGPLRRPGAVDHQRTRAALADVDATDLAQRPFHALSGGQRQRILVARALASDPEILVLDEPTNGMDLPSERAMLELVRSFTARGIAVVLISHQLGAVADHVDKLVVVAGHEHPVAVGPRAELLTSERLSKIYERPIVVRAVDGHSVIYVGDRP